VTGTRCKVTVVTSDGTTYIVEGKWVGCEFRGQEWVRTWQTPQGLVVRRRALFQRPPFRPLRAQVQRPQVRPKVQ
jgi:hypothetical protein